MINKIIDLFRVRKEELSVTIIVVIVSCFLNALNVIKHIGVQSAIMPDEHIECIKNWHIAGFDPITYSVMTHWNSGYNIYRHPLLAYFLWPFTKLNECIITLTGYNCAIIITALLLVFFSTYSYLFLSRIFIEIIGLKRNDAYVLSFLNFAFAYVLLTMIVPDHFGPSMFCLILLLYISGKMLQSGRMLSWWQTILMFIFTAGISLNNGLKVFTAALFIRNKSFFNPIYLVIAVLLPSALIWGSARLGYKAFVLPNEIAKNEKVREKFEQQICKLQDKALTAVDAKDTARILFVQDSIRNVMMEKRELRKKRSAYYRHTGKPFMEGGFMRWTDATTNRLEIAVESLFGEGIIMHEDYLLGDVLVNRPVIVHYNNKFNYIVETVIVVLFIAGIWSGRRSRFMWVALSFFFIDMFLHMVLGFGINEISIMSAHYLFVLPICMGFLQKNLNEKWRKTMIATILIITIYLFAWNSTLLYEYLFLV